MGKISKLQKIELQNTNSQNIENAQHHNIGILHFSKVQNIEVAKHRKAKYRSDKILKA